MAPVPLTVRTPGPPLPARTNPPPAPTATLVTDPDPASSPPLCTVTGPAPVPDWLFTIRAVPLAVTVPVVNVLPSGAARTRAPPPVTVRLFAEAFSGPERVRLLPASTRTTASPDRVTGPSVPLAPPTLRSAPPPPTPVPPSVIGLGPNCTPPWTSRVPPAPTVTGCANRPSAVGLAAVRIAPGPTDTAALNVLLPDSVSRPPAVELLTVSVPVEVPLTGPDHAADPPPSCTAEGPVTYTGRAVVHGGAPAASATVPPLSTRSPPDPSALSSVITTVPASIRVCPV